MLKSQLCSSPKRIPHISELAQKIFAIYGAEPLQPHGSRQSVYLGQRQAVGNGNAVLVAVASPNKAVNGSLLKKICSYSASQNRWDEIVVIGWRFEPQIETHIAALNDPCLDVLQIPLWLLDEFQKNSVPAALKKHLCFIGLVRPSLLLHSMSRTQFMPHADEMLIVNLDNYVPLSSNAALQTTDDSHWQQAAKTHVALNLLSYWAVDPDYDGVAFRPLWEYHRSNNHHSLPVESMKTQAVLTLDARQGERRICVRAVDVYGLQSVAEATLAALDWS
jgi:adenine-specific DNA-methyltransferase